MYRINAKCCRLKIQSSFSDLIVIYNNTLYSILSYIYLLIFQIIFQYFIRYIVNKIPIFFTFILIYNIDISMYRVQV